MYGYVLLISLIILIVLTIESTILFQMYKIFERSCSYTVCFSVFLIESTLPGEKKMWLSTQKWRHSYLIVQRHNIWMINCLKLFSTLRTSCHHMLLQWVTGKIKSLSHQYTHLQPDCQWYRQEVLPFCSIQLTKKTAWISTRLLY